VRGGSVGIEDVIGGGQGDGVGEVADGGGVVSGGESGVALGFGFVGHRVSLGGLGSEKGMILIMARLGKGLYAM